MKRGEAFLQKTFTNKPLRVALHILFWLLMLASYYYFNTISFNPATGTPATYLLALHNALTMATAFYLLMYVIWLRAFAKRRWGLGLALLLVWLVFIATLVSWGDWAIFNRCKACGDRLALYNPDYYRFLQRSLPNIVFVRVVSGGLLYQLVIQLSFPVAIKIGRSYFRQTLQQLQLAKDNLQLEFNFLKAQVKPHFLFNTLNNVYALVVAERNAQAAATLARLSGFMRYTLYETGDEKISLDKEVQLLKDYVELEKLRLNETTVLFGFESDDPAYTIPPLLLMPAIENAFKFTVDKSGSRICISIVASGGNLQVAIENNFDSRQAKTTGGIGLQNLQKRVQQTYGKQAQYRTSAVNDIFLFQLSLPLI